MPTPITWPLWSYTDATGTAAGVATASANAEVVTAVQLKVESVYAPFRTQVYVTFTRPVKMTTALTGALRTFNYKIDGWYPSAVEQVDYREVMLTLGTPLNIETLYTLVVDNVEDTLGNPVSPA